MCTDLNSRCLIPPSPELRGRINEELSALHESALVTGAMLGVSQPKRPGMNDGLIIPGNYFPLGTPLEAVQSVAADRAPLRGALRVVVVLVDFPDLPMGAAHNRGHFQDLFFSRGVLNTGSVREYFAEASHGLIDVVGEVVGPYRMPLSLAAYAGGNSGTGSATPNARTMARHAAEAANRDVNFAPYDNDGNGFVDAFIVIHAGQGGETTGSGSDIWSHKWVLSNGEYNADGTKIYAYLTVPEDAKIGVCCHELGHLLFGWPDLYDTDYSSEGLGNFCLMAGGSWNGGGDVPSHPSAWCKMQQGWINVINQTQNASISIADIKDSQVAYRLWKGGAMGKEYFLVENRQRRQYDRLLPGEGLMIYHIDDNATSNADERRPKVALMQADGRADLTKSVNRGDAGDCYPGNTNNFEFSTTSNPNSKSYGGVATGVAVKDISRSGSIMNAKVTVRAATTAKPKIRIRFPWFWAPRAVSGGTDLETRREQLIRELVELYADQGTKRKRPRAEDSGDDWREAIEDRLAAIERALQTGGESIDGGEEWEEEEAEGEESYRG